MSARGLPPPVRCRACEYDLSGLDVADRGGRCPECGTPCNPANPYRPLPAPSVARLLATMCLPFIAITLAHPVVRLILGEGALVVLVTMTGCFTIGAAGIAGLVWPIIYAGRTIAGEPRRRRSASVVIPVMVLALAINLVVFLLTVVLLL